MIVGELKKALGTGKKVFAEIVSVADGDTIDTGLRDLDVVIVTPTVKGRIASATKSGGVITIGLTDNAGNAITTAEPVFVLAIGNPR